MEKSIELTEILPLRCNVHLRPDFVFTELNFGGSLFAMHVRDCTLKGLTHIVCHGKIILNQILRACLIFRGVMHCFKIPLVFPLFQ